MRAKYYPRVDIQYSYTPFNVQEANVPDLYSTPIPDTATSPINSIEIDLYDCLKKEWGDALFVNRDVAYILLSGHVPEYMVRRYRVTKDEYYQYIFKSFYDRFAVFQNSVNLELFFGDKNSLFLPRFIKSIRKKVDSYQKHIQGIVANTSKGTVLMTTHDRMYIAYRTKIPENLAKKGRVIQNV